MYLTVDQACNAQSGESPLPASVIADSQANTASADAAVMDANANWLNAIARTWQSFADCGPNVAAQLLGGTDVGPEAPSTPAGVVLISPGDPSAIPVGAVPPNGGNPVQNGGPSAFSPRGSSGARSGRALNKGSQQDAIDFVQRFGRSPIKTYTGPPPAPGSVTSLVYGGASESLEVGPGVYAQYTPDPRFGYAPQCALPGTSSASPGGGFSPDTWGVAGTLLALVALAGLGVWANHSEKKRGRAA